MIRGAVLVGAALLGCACAGAGPLPRISSPLPSEDPIRPRDRIEAVAVGAPDPTPLSEIERKATSREAALRLVRHQLVVSIRALKLQSGITLEQASALDPGMSDRIEQAVSAVEPSIEFTPDDGCVARLELSKRKLGEELGVRIQ